MGVREKKLKQQLGRVCGLGGPQAGLGEAGFPVGTVAGGVGPGKRSGSLHQITAGEWKWRVPCSKMPSELNNNHEVPWKSESCHK